MEKMPIYFDLLFIIVVTAVVFQFYKAAGSSHKILFILSGWLIVQGVIGISGFYTTSFKLPPRLLLAMLPPLAIIIILFNTVRGRAFIDSIDLKKLMLIHIVRIMVEFILYGLFIYKYIPEAMTFAGQNFDILSGITAPLVFYFAFTRKLFNRRLLLIWNVICLFLLINVVIIAILSVPYPIQQLNFSQPNIGILMMPYVWLPAFVVPIVLFSHLVAIRQLLVKGIFKKVECIPPVISIPIT